MKKNKRIEGWWSGEFNDTFYRGDDLNQAHVSLCSQEMYALCAKKQMCKLEYDFAWGCGWMGARDYLGIKGRGKLTAKQEKKIEKKCRSGLKKCRKIFIELGEVRDETTSTE